MLKGKRMREDASPRRNWEYGVMEEGEWGEVLFAPLDGFVFRCS
jgi:hypothetical protein